MYNRIQRYVYSTVENINLAKRGKAAFTESKGGAGLPRHKFDNVHVAFRIVDNRLDSEKL